MQIRLLTIALFFLAPALMAQDLLFTEISDSAGTGNGPNNNGIVVGDYDNDGLDDFFVPANSAASRIFKNMGDGTFDDVTESTGIVTNGLTKTGAWGDIDNDGDLDLFVGTFYTTTVPNHNYLYLNNGDGTFTDISESSNVDTYNATRSAHMADLNLDGYLDIYVCNINQQNILWTNNGDNTFTNTIFTAGLLDNLISMGAIFFDYDNDGDQDVYLTHDANQPNIMYENNGNGTFTNVSAETGLNLGSQGMGVDHGDINNDGHLDVYVTNLGPNFLFLNDGTGHFIEMAELAGVDDAGMGWGCFFLDYDNDGWEDIYVINDSQFSPVTNKLYRNNADNTFTEVSANTPLSSFHNGKGGIWADINNDGYLEIIIANNENTVGVQIFENNYSENNWIGFYLEGTEDAHDACGTRIQVTTINGNKIDEVTCGSSYASMSPRRIYFGLGSGDVSQITITWPNGTTDYFETLPINEIHTIQQGVSTIDNDGDGFSVNIDCDDTNENINPGLPEIVYNGWDDDCNPLTLDDDLDEDGFNNALDCDDTNAEVNPNMIEQVYNGWDDDCNPLTLDDDLDEDGFNSALDCDDTNAEVNPDMTEQAYNGLDDDCNPLTPDDDLDNDGFVLANDCDDTNGTINDGAAETAYNGIDDDCNPLTPDDDLDGDGYNAALDCDDENESIYPGNSETVYNGFDDDCNTTTLDDDLDGDGFTISQDCDDNNMEINPGGIEIANNGIDEDCDGGDLIIAVAEATGLYIELYPNPAQDVLWITCNQNLYFNIQVMDLTGRILATEFTSDKLELTKLPSGLYILNLNNEEVGLSITKRLEVNK
jgi:enediyne biosynthesis protein E4